MYVHLGEVFRVLDFVHYIRYEREGVSIFSRPIVQVTIVLAWSFLGCPLFVNKEEGGSHW